MPSNQTPYMLIQAGSEASQADITQQIYSVDVEDVDRGCDKVTILMADAGSANADAVREGMTIWVDLGWETEHALIFEGLVEKVKPTAVAGGHRLEVVAYDYSAQMRKPRTPELTPKHVGTLKDILEALAKRNTIPIPFGKVEIGSMPSFTDDRPLLQGTMTDFEFIQFLAEEYRARAFVEVNEKPTDAVEVKKRTRVSSFYFMSEDALLAQEPAGKLTYCRGFGALIEFEYKRVASGAAPSSTATVTDPDTGEPSTVSGDPPAIGPDNEGDADRADRIGSVQSPGRAQSVPRRRSRSRMTSQSNWRTCASVARLPVCRPIQSWRNAWSGRTRRACSDSAGAGSPTEQCFYAPSRPSRSSAWPRGRRGAGTRTA